MSNVLRFNSGSQIFTNQWINVLMKYDNNDGNINNNNNNNNKIEYIFLLKMKPTCQVN